MEHWHRSVVIRRVHGPDSHVLRVEKPRARSRGRGPVALVTIALPRDPDTRTKAWARREKNWTQSNAVQHTISTSIRAYRQTPDGGGGGGHRHEHGPFYSDETVLLAFLHSRSTLPTTKTSKSSHIGHLLKTS